MYLREVGGEKTNACGIILIPLMYVLEGNETCMKMTHLDFGGGTNRVAWQRNIL